MGSDVPSFGGKAWCPTSSWRLAYCTFLGTALSPFSVNLYQYEIKV